MIITYQDGQQAEAILLEMTGSEARLLLRGAADVEVFTKFHDAWISETCEPVTLRLAAPKPAAPEYRDTDFVCHPDLAARLIAMLPTDSEPATALPSMPRPADDAPLAGCCA